MKISSTLFGASALVGLALSAAPAAAQSTLADVKARGALNCGVSEGLAGFSIRDDRGNWSGFDVDFCKAVAAAVLGDGKKVTYVPLSAEARFEALKSGKIDVLSRNSTWTMSREGALGLKFTGVTYYDGQGFLVKRKPEISSALEMENVKVCVQAGTTTQANAVDFLTTNNVKHEIVTLPTVADVVTAYDTGRCNVITSDVSQLHGLLITLNKPGESVILPDVISKEPLGPAVRQNDPQWFEIVKWTQFALLNAEELGVSSKTLDTALGSKKVEVKRLVGADGNFGEQIGLTKDWAVKAIRAVGNYAEIFERNVGVQSPLGIPRGLNQLWSMGGIQYAPPIR